MTKHFHSVMAIAWPRCWRVLMLMLSANFFVVLVWGLLFGACCLGLVVWGLLFDFCYFVISRPLSCIPIWIALDNHPTIRNRES